MGKIIETVIEGSRGQLTGRMAREITPYWEEHGYSVLYDHDPSSENVTKIVSSFGEQPYSRRTQLSHVDIAIVEKISDRVFALIEIEETTDKPETFLGDIFGVLMGDYISFGKKRPLSVDEHTSLFVFVKSKVSRRELNKHLHEKVMKIKSMLSTGNSAIGWVDIKPFRDEKGLSVLLPFVLDRALMGEL